MNYADDNFMPSTGNPFIDNMLNDLTQKTLALSEPMQACFHYGIQLSAEIAKAVLKYSEVEMRKKYPVFCKEWDVLYPDVKIEPFKGKEVKTETERSVNLLFLKMVMDVAFAVIDKEPDKYIRMYLEEMYSSD